MSNVNLKRQNSITLTKEGLNGEYKHVAAQNHILSIHLRQNEATALRCTVRGDSLHYGVWFAKHQ